MITREEALEAEETEQERRSNEPTRIRKNNRVLENSCWNLFQEEENKE